MEGVREIQCTEVWGGNGSCDVSVKLAGVRGECWSQAYEGAEKGGDIHFLSVCGMSILSKVVLADVSGHGGETAEVSRIIHDALVESIGAHDNSTMMEQVNEAFVRRRRAFHFTTMVATIIDSRDRSLVYAYAGHPAILHGARATGRFAPVRPRGERPGVPLGVLTGPELRYAQYLTQLQAGDVLVVYTDAFTEARDEEGELLGEAGLIRLLESAPSRQPAELKAHVLGSLEDQLDDDASLIILEVL